MTTNEIAVRCSRCGAEFPGSKLFCTGCGKPNRSRPTTVAPPPPPLSTPPPARAATPVDPSQGLRPAAGALPVSSGPRSYVTPLPMTSTVTGVEEPMGWETLLLYSAISLGVVGVVFAFKQTLWAKRMDRASTAHGRLLLACLLPILAIALMIGAMAAPPEYPAKFLAFAAIPVLIVALILGILYTVSLVNTLRTVAQFNGVPLRVRFVWGMFGGVLYFQHCIRTIELHCGALQNP